MAKLDDLKNAVSTLTTEVGETLADVNKKLDELKAQIPDPNMQAEIDAITAQVSEASTTLDKLQNELYPKTEPEPAPVG